MTPFLPRGFVVPEHLDHAQFSLRPLKISDVVKDYEAVMTSIPRLRGLFGPTSTWPSPELSFEQDLIDLGWHHKEFQMRRSFAYTLSSLDGGMCLGCVYVYPTAVAGYDAEAYCWVRSSHAALDPILMDALKDWFARAWPFRRIALPGRELDWSEWVPR